ncbi:hypothetical protein Tsubulata_043668 [Turnera subulata]|uniref:Bifunctional inhibitor/plant lipid transfer protein/seed storage helical domain-containing protein n=1 Tax=Turnera subulata TaxID=218843 RepID=A0A9Q0J790_9ROSI|nr:hypothetical protein Tsubulata_043668 [Turnera subulata]
MEGSRRKVVIVAALAMAFALLSSPMLANGDTQFIFCRMTKDGLKACEPSVSGTNPVAPSSSCCSALSKADMNCLCFFKNYPGLLSAYNIDPTLAMELPAKCNLPNQSSHC